MFNTSWCELFYNNAHHYVLNIKKEIDVKQNFFHWHSLAVRKTFKGFEVFSFRMKVCLLVYESRLFKFYFLLLCIRWCQEKKVYILFWDASTLSQPAIVSYSVFILDQNSREDFIWNIWVNAMSRSYVINMFADNGAHFPWHLSLLLVNK